MVIFRRVEQPWCCASRSYAFSSIGWITEYTSRLFNPENKLSFDTRKIPVNTALKQCGLSFNAEPKKVRKNLMIGAMP